MSKEKGKRKVERVWSVMSKNEKRVKVDWGLGQPRGGLGSLSRVGPGRAASVSQFLCI